MLDLPQSTEVKRPLPKAQLYKRFEWKSSQRESFDADISRLDFVNWISPRTLPSIAEGSKIKEIFVVEILLKKRDFDPKNITLLAKSIPQRIVFLLRYGDEIRIAVYHTKLFLTDWQSYLSPGSSSLTIQGLNLDAVWENIVSSIGNISVAQDKSLSEQIKVDEERDKLLRQIEALEKQMNTIKQPRRKRELFVELKKIRRDING